MKKTGGGPHPQGDTPAVELALWINEGRWKGWEGLQHHTLAELATRCSRH